MKSIAPNCPHSPRYDRAFEPAVQAGFITIYEATARGNRQRYADHLSQRFCISIEIALTVTDNRMRLHEAVQAAEKAREKASPGRRRMGRLLKYQVATLIVGSVILTGLIGADQWQTEIEVGRQLEQLSKATAVRVRKKAQVPAASTAPVAETNPRTTVERDELGKITRVSASRPRDVLVALCDAAPVPVECVSIEVLPTRPPFPGRRLGAVTLSHPFGESRTLTIVRERHSGRWLAGTGLAPIGFGAQEATKEEGTTACEGPGYDCAASEGVKASEAGDVRSDRS